MGESRESGVEMNNKFVASQQGFWLMISSTVEDFFFNIGCIVMEFLRWIFRFIVK